MFYEKPEIVVLGEAACLIQGAKKDIGEGGPGHVVADCELDD